MYWIVWGKTYATKKEKLFYFYFFFWGGEREEYNDKNGLF